MPAQDGGEVGVGDGGVAAADELDEGGDFVADGDLREAGFLRESEMALSFAL
jgi:hypothetical protein